VKVGQWWGSWAVVRQLGSGGESWAVVGQLVRGGTAGQWWGSWAVVGQSVLVGQTGGGGQLGSESTYIDCGGGYEGTSRGGCEAEVYLPLHVYRLIYKIA
jgi:hypothetical protein